MREIARRRAPVDRSNKGKEGFLAIPCLVQIVGSGNPGGAGSGNRWNVGNFPGDCLHNATVVNVTFCQDMSSSFLGGFAVLTSERKPTSLTITTTPTFDDTALQLAQQNTRDLYHVYFKAQAVRSSTNSRSLAPGHLLKPNSSRSCTHVIVRLAPYFGVAHTTWHIFSQYSRITL